MAPSTSPPSEADSSDRDAWPWPCIDCGTTIFHDSDYCRECDSARSRAETAERVPSGRGFTGWMRREPYPTFVAKTALISGIELVLTALWLHLTLAGPTELLQAGLFFA